MTVEAPSDSYTTNANQFEHKDVDDSSTQGSTDTDYRNWDSTPPSSPEVPSSQTPDPQSAMSTNLSKMALDFIAPGAQANRFASSASSTRTTGELDAQDTTAIPQNQFPRPATNVATTSSPSPAWPTLSEAPHFALPPLPPPTPSARPSRRRLNPPPLAPNGPTPRRRKPPTRRPDQREDRHPYDTEEKYAIIHLRVIKNLEWNKVLGSFHRLFPPGELRRRYTPSSPRDGAGSNENDHASLPDKYTQRNVQGLQCRWYRIRQEEGLVKLRESRRGGFLTSPAVGRKEKRVLERMERVGDIGKEFLESLRGANGVQGFE